ncbi:alpha/beta hydrolase family protein [Streptosporangium saharense]|uniref:alpha/beta hydrolase family protein n=1 Tax=Streptosporangium saharense TaxID=1706840 RepID=UPI003689EE56
MSEPISGPVIRGALTAAVLLTLVAPATATAAPTPTLALPAPTGPYGVGTTALHLEDATRPDPWVAEQRTRHLMVTLWYPTRTRHGGTAPYMTTQEAALLLEEQGAKGVPPEALSGTRTNAVLNAPVAGHGLPLVVLSPGFSLPRSSLTALAEDLASRGYVVAGIDHTHETATTFPDGHTETCTVCKTKLDAAFGEKSARTRAADVSFVLDRLTGPRPAWKDARVIDRSRIGMAGHSVGGAATTWTMLEDRRIDAGVNLDGTFWAPIPARGLSRPFLLVGEDKNGPDGGDPTWAREWRRMTGWKRWITVDRATHGTYTDHTLLMEQLGGDIDQGITGARALEITRRYVGAFFDLHLRGRSRPLLDGPSKRHPEVRFWDTKKS